MSIHDWTRVDANLFHDFHRTWTVSIASRLNSGIHKAIWDEVEDQPFSLPPDKPLTLAAYVAGLPKTAYVEPIGVGDVLPDMPAYLDEDSYVPIPLEATYRATWESCLADMREAVERGLPLEGRVLTRPAAHRLHFRR